MLPSNIINIYQNMKTMRSWSLMILSVLSMLTDTALQTSFLCLINVIATIKDSSLFQNQN